MTAASALRTHEADKKLWLVHRHADFDRIATPYAYVLGFHSKVTLMPFSILAESGRHIAPGRRLDITSDFGLLSSPFPADQKATLEYVGCLPVGNLILMCFDLLKEGLRLNLPAHFAALGVTTDDKPYKKAYVSFLWLDPRRWFFSTPGQDGRVITDPSRNFYTEKGDRPHA